MFQRYVTAVVLEHFTNVIIEMKNTNIQHNTKKTIPVAQVRFY